jgi:hypothetical protein
MVYTTYYFVGFSLPFDERGKAAILFMLTVCKSIIY